MDGFWDRLLGVEYCSLTRALVGPVVKVTEYRRLRHFWLELPDCCALVRVDGTVKVGDRLPLPADLAFCRRKSQRWARAMTRLANEDIRLDAARRADV